MDRSNSESTVSTSTRVLFGAVFDPLLSITERPYRCPPGVTPTSRTTPDVDLGSLHLCTGAYRYPACARTRAAARRRRWILRHLLLQLLLLLLQVG
jgi:hypothetical protein